MLGDVTLPASVTQGLKPTQQAGARLFEQNGCINCHTIAGAGGERGPNLTTIGAPDAGATDVAHPERRSQHAGVRDTLTPQETSAAGRVPGSQR